VQVFSSAGSFFALGMQNGADALPRSLLSAALSGPEFLLRYGHFDGVKNALNVFAFRLAVFSVFILQLVLLLKRTIRTPLITVTDRLKALNSPTPASGKVIDILRNDEYARVFELINSLILRQRDQLEISRRRLEGIVEGAADPIIALDPMGAIRIFNPAAEAAFGYAFSEAIGKGLDLLLPDAPPSSAMRELGSEGASARLARRPWRRKDGTLVTMESHLSRDCERDEAWTTLILRDVSRQAEIENNLTRARTDAENANRMKSEFLANMSHELRTPLNAILGYTQLMADDRNLTDAQREKIGVISRSGEHLLALINDILDISKIEAGKMELRAQAFDLRRFVADLGDMFDLKCRKKGLALYVETLAELPRYVEADLGKLRQVMINLLGNAVKFTSEGGVSILVGRDEADPARIKFAVRDTGRGIPDAERELIMLPFVQASTTDHEGGTGLGLAISSRYIAMMGGSLEVASALGEGSTFSFSLDLPEREVPAETGAAEDASLTIASDTESTVLVVDDLQANRLVLKEMLERSGFTVAEAADGREAIERAREMKPDIIFMDIKMPVMDGYDAVAALKLDPATAGIRVFALTASAFSHDEARIAAAGFDGFLAKPFKLGALYRLIREKGGVALREATAIAAASAAATKETGPIDFAAAAAALGESGRSALEGAALINDFVSLAAQASSLLAAAPAFAAALKAAADSYDEAKVAELLAALGSPSGGRE
ncbi:MAG: response regulator, partial [Spirochaetaceae bacterium]|nr:response regulator [Spirochaetaceae bacterium]